MTRQSCLNFKLFLFLFLAVRIMPAQNQLSYSPLRCAGEIPRDFLELSSEKVYNEKKKISEGNQSRKDKKLEKEFALSSNFGVDEMLYSGKVLYGDPLSVYINKVADKVLESEPELRTQLRFYVLKTSSVNAFSTNQGIIFVSVGLISQVENEAQLAYILCHEISHFVKKHTLESYKRNREIIAGKGRFKQLDFEERVKEVYSYSKEHEIEADKEGLKLFLKTGYNTAAALSSFDVLLYAYLPYDEIEWNVRELQDSFYKFPASYTPSKGKDISAEEDDDDEESTHPNVRKRKAEVERLLDDENPGSGSAYYLMGKDYFNYIQQQSRIELFYILIGLAQYEKAYYLSYLYRNNYNDTAYASKIAAYCIYAKAVKQLTEKESSSLNISENYVKPKEEGAFYYVAYFFDEMNKKEMAVLSVRMTWNAFMKNPGDSFYRNIFEESAKNLFKYTDLTISRFYSELDTSRTTEISQDTIEKKGGNLSKIEKLKIKKKKQVKVETKDLEKSDTKEYFRYAFLEAYKDDYFRETLEDAYSRWKDHDEETQRKIFDPRQEKWKKKYGIAANIDSLILVNPYFSKVVIGRKKKRNLLFDERQEVTLASKYLEMARLNDVNVAPLDLHDKQNLTTEKLNEYAMIMEWLNERLNNFSSDMVLFNSQFISDVVKAKGTSKLCLSGISYTVEKQEFSAQTFVFSAFVFPLFPVYLYWQLHQKHQFNLTSIIFDLESGKLVYIASDPLKMKYKKKDYVNNQIYALFNQIKTKNK